MSKYHYLEKELYERLQSDPQLFRWLEQGSLDGIWYWDLQSQENEWLSPKFKETFGYGIDEIPHTSEWWQKNIFPEDLAGVLDNFEKHCADPSHPYDQVVRYRHKSGKTIWVRCRGMVMFDEAGEPMRMLGAHTDVTSLMETKSALEKTSQELNHALEVNKLALSTSKIGVWTWYLCDDSLSWNSEMFSLYRLDATSPKVNYADWQKCVHPDDLASAESELQQCIDIGKKFDTVFRIIWPNGEIRYIHAMADIYCDDTNKPVRLLGANWDVTEEKHREIELARSNDELSTFAYVASHDLKAPLRSIKTLAHFIREDIGDTAEVEKNLEMMEARIGRMENLLNDLLEYSRVGQGKGNKVEEVDIKTLIYSVFDFLSPPKAFTLNTLGDFPSFNIEKTPFEKVLRNLIGNAIKHRASDDGSVTVWVNEEALHYRFYIADNGNAIPVEHHEKIFEMFQTLKPRDEVEGSGMGLAIVKKTLLKQQGDIGLVSNSLKDNPSSHYSNQFFFTWPKHSKNS